MSGNVKKEIQKDIERCYQEIALQKKESDKVLQTKIDAADFRDFQSQISAQVDEKVDVKEVQNALNECQTDILKNILELKAEVENNLNSLHNDFRDDLKFKVSVDDFNKVMGQKLDANTIQPILFEKLGPYNTTQLKEEIFHIQQELEDKKELKQL